MSSMPVTLANVMYNTPCISFSNSRPLSPCVLTLRSNILLSTSKSSAWRALVADRPKLNLDNGDGSLASSRLNLRVNWLRNNTLRSLLDGRGK